MGFRLETPTQDKLQDRLDKAHVILLPVDNAFLAHPRAEAVIAKAVEEAQVDSKVVLPILLEACPWEETDLRDLPVLPRNRRPLDDPYWASPEKALQTVLEEITATIEDLERFLDPLEERPGRVFALFTGIDQYATPSLTPLTGCARDANELAATLRDRLGADHLTSNTLLDLAAREEAFKAQLRTYLAEARADDVVLVYFAGHGRNRHNGAFSNEIFFHDHDPDTRRGMFDEEAFRAFVERHAVNDPSVVLILDTHAGSDGWLDRRRDNHVVISACTDTESADEADGHGVFTAALLAELHAATGGITYRQLVRRIRERLAGSFRQLPLLWASEAGGDRLFLGAANDETPRVLERLRNAGYYAGDIASADDDAVTKAVDRFRGDWSLTSGDDVAELLECLALARRDGPLPVAVIGGDQPEAVDEALDRLFRELPYPVDARYHNLADRRRKAATKTARPRGSSENPASLVDEVRFLVLLIDDVLLRAPETEAVVNRIQHHRQSEYLPVVPLLVEQCDWAGHPVAELPEMRLYRSKGRFGEPGWVTEEGMRWLRDELDKIGRFLSSPAERQYRQLCARFRDDMPFEEMEVLRGELQTAVQDLPDLDFLFDDLGPATPQALVFGAACALLERPEAQRAAAVVDYLRAIQDGGPLHEVRLNVVYQLVDALGQIAEADTRRKSPALAPAARETTIDVLFALNREPRVRRDAAKAGRSSLSYNIFQTIRRLAEELPRPAAEYFFRAGQVAIPLESAILSAGEVGVPLPIQQVVSFFSLCEEFDGEMPARAMDDLGRRLKKQIGTLETVDWLGRWLLPDVFQGYVYGIAFAAQERPGAAWLPPLVNFLDALAGSPGMGDIRLRVLYRLLMALEAVLPQAFPAEAAESDADRRARLIDILTRIDQNERAREDTRRTGGKGIGGRIARLVRQLGLPIGDARARERVLARRLEKARETGRLDLEGLGLTDVPDVVLDLTGLETLSLKNNALEHIPGWLAKLPNLRTLDLSKNRLRDIGPLAGLPQLEVVDLYENQISDLAPLAGLTKLSKTNLSSNQITGIEPLAALPQIKGLDLDSNQIENVAPLLGLQAPEWIDLRFNRIRELPPALLDLGLELKWANDYKEGIILEGNPIENVPEEVLREGHEAIRAFFNRPAPIDADRLREALYRLPFRAQLEVATEEVDAGARVIPLLLPAPEAAGPGLLVDLICDQYELPVEWLIRIPLSSVANYGWSEQNLIRAILNGIGVGTNAAHLDFDAFLDQAAGQDRYQEIVLSLEDTGDIPEHLLADFLRECLAFADRLARKLGSGNRASGLRQVWFLMQVKQLPAGFTADEYGGWISPVVLPPAEKLTADDLVAWMKTDMPDELRSVVNARILPAFQPVFGMELIARICAELDMIETVYERYFRKYAPPATE